MIGKPGTRISPDTVHRKVGSNDSHCGRQSRHAHIRHVRGDRNAGHRRRTATKAVVSRRLAAGLVLGFATEAIGTAAGPPRRAALARHHSSFLSARRPASVIRRLAPTR
jgi:hypothetical protein